MDDIALLTLRDRLNQLLEKTPRHPPPIGQLPDKWIAASALQKGIRRGNVELAIRALDTLWKIDPRYARKRLAIIAFEDVGLGAPDIVAVTVMACSGTKYLQKEKIYPAVRACAISLATSAKERSAEHIYTLLAHHDAYELIRDRFAHKTPHQLVDIIIDTDRYLIERSAAAWLLAGTKRFGVGLMPEVQGDLGAFEWALEQLNMPLWQPLATMAGIRVTQCALPVFWPLKLSQKECGEAAIINNSRKLSADQSLVPSYALDQFTRGGKAEFMGGAMTDRQCAFLGRSVGGVKNSFVFSAIISALMAFSSVNANAKTHEELETDLEKALLAIQKLEAAIADLQTNPPLEKELPVSEAGPVQSKSGPVVTDVEERIEELETIVTEIDQRVGSRAVVSAFDADSFDIGGFFDGTVPAAFGGGSQDSAFNRQTFEILAKAQLSKDWDIFVAQAFIRQSPLTYTEHGGRHEPSFGNNNSPVSTDTVIARAQYSHSDELNIQFGRFITPAGIINIEHFPAILLDPEQPQFLRPFSGQTIFANFTNGIHFHGSTFTGPRGKNILSYNVWGGGFAGNSNAFSFGGRLAYALKDTGVTIGVNTMSGDRLRGVANDRFYVGGADILFDKGRWIWKSEIFYSVEGGGDDRFAFYSQPGFRVLPNLIGFYRFDYLDKGSQTGEAIEHVAGISFNPVHNVRLRGIYRHRNFTLDPGLVEIDVNEVQLSTTFNF